MEGRPVVLKTKRGPGGRGGCRHRSRQGDVQAIVVNPPFDKLTREKRASLGPILAKS